jgi:hypothetical protein
MPDEEGEWELETYASLEALDGHKASFSCVPPSEGNHGPVGVIDRFHFAYADGTPYYQVGTTCYAWVHQESALQAKTLETLAAGPFNKIRMCVFPKSYRYNRNEPPLYPFEGEPLEDWDFTRPNPAHFRNLERRVEQLRDLGIEADIILFHPYDRWGFSDMPAEADDRYLRYVVARLAAYRNVWWSMANEYDFMRTKCEADWERYFRIVQRRDPYQRLRSIHNGHRWYDHGKPWVTHASVQSSDLHKMTQWRETYGKPIVVDECRYEGNIEEGWGNITAEDLVHRFWQGTAGGGYVGHGETYLHPDDLLWWSKGGELRGESPERIAFLRRLLEDGPPGGFHPAMHRWDRHCVQRGDGAEYLIYFGWSQPAEHSIEMPAGERYQVEVIDTWRMTTDALEGEYSGRFTIPLPGRPLIAVRLRRI